jgi:acyl-CoA synthetase (AMP-forming)/AMP-acid ligase II
MQIKPELPLALHDLLFNQGQPNESIAIEDILGQKITYGHLREQISSTVGSLNSMGFKRNDRIAIALPNGPEMLVVSICLASGFTLCPLNPNHREGELGRDLDIPGIKALLAEHGSGTPVRKVAQEQGIEVLEISPKEGTAGLFQLINCDARGGQDPAFAKPEDDMIVVITSGTTAKPKMIPLTHSNEYYNSVFPYKALKLSPEDRCLNLLPCFHLAGLNIAIIHMAAGGCVMCPPEFTITEFFKWVEKFRPTLYWASPTQNQLILGQVGENIEVASRSRLRFIITGGGSLPVSSIIGLENAFKAPVLDWYGMSEAGAISVNPLPPQQRKPGSVGLSMGPDVAIMGDGQMQLTKGKIGEVVIRGPNVFRGYEKDPEANVAAFVDGWFRTGDLGYLDEDGYLYIRGRVKEIINKGAEKIAPQEIDEALLKHPAVAEAVAFPVPHPTLGEDVAAAVVPRGGSSVTENELRVFLFDSLAYFKVPTRIVVIEEIPKGPLGKMKRSEMARELGFI